MIFMYVYVLPATLTTAKSGKGKKMHAQIITYQLNDISQTEYLKQMVEPDAPILADVSGLISKVWLADDYTVNEEASKITRGLK